MIVDDEITPNFLKDCADNSNRKFTRPDLKNYDQNIDDIGKIT